MRAVATCYFGVEDGLLACRRARFPESRVGSSLLGSLGSIVIDLLGIFGGVGSVTAPWASWRVREAVDGQPDNLPGFVNSSRYSAIKPHLKPEVVDKLENIDLIATVGHSKRPVTHIRLIQDEMTRLEQEWGLI